MRYVESKIEEKEVESAYRVFISEGIKILTKNTGSDRERQIMNMNFAQYMEKMKKPPETRTPEEIITGIKDKLNSLGGDTE